VIVFTLCAVKAPVSVFRITCCRTAAVSTGVPSRKVSGLAKFPFADGSW
jgi:hypothetical protein